MKRIYPSLAAMALTLAGCSKPATSPAAAPARLEPASVRVVRATTGEISRLVSLPGTVVANQRAALFAKITGYLKSISVDKGDAVKAGAVLAEIEAPELVADTAKFKADLEIARLDYDRAAEAQKKAPDLVTQQSVDALKAKWLAAEAALNRAATLLNFGKITAPFSGTVTMRYADPGAFIAAATSGSSPRSAAILELMDFETVRVQVPVPETEVPLVRGGLPVLVNVAELPGKTFTAKVSRSASALDENTRTMLIEADIPNSDKQLLPGMFATARIAVEKHEHATLVPVEAVAFEKAGPSVFALENGTAKKTSVKTGFNDGKMVEIIEGISPGTSLILAGKTPLANGQAVKIQEL